MRALVAVVIMLLLPLLLQACGHKGPLFMPQPETQQPNQGQ